MSHGLLALIVDYGGVLTTDVNAAFGTWAAKEQIDLELMGRIVSEHLHDEGPENLVHALERGEISTPEFERQFAAQLRKLDGTDVPADGLLRRAFAAMGAADPMLSAVRLAKQAGLRTALLSNSWGLDYDRTGWDGLFDAVVISGEVGLRKPEPEIYQLAAERLKVRPQECVFVDDLAKNVLGAVAAGMVGVHHVHPDATLDELEVLFGLSLRLSE